MTTVRKLPVEPNTPRWIVVADHVYNTGRMLLPSLERIRHNAQRDMLAYSRERARQEAALRGVWGDRANREWWSA